MAKRESFIRYKLIIEMLRNKKEASFEEISDYLDRAKDVHGENLNISLRTFQRDLDEMRSLNYVNIRCNDEHKYYIAEYYQSEYVSRLIEDFNVFNAFRGAEKLYPYVIWETRRAMGSENIHGLLHAIRNRFVVSFIHVKYDDDVKTVRTVEPYALKEFKGRWYLLAKDLKNNEIRNFGLDRISELEITKRKFKYPEELNVKVMFHDCFGIINPTEEEPEEIVLSFTAEQGKYVKSYPLHHSQKVLKDNDDELRISLKLKITYDFIQELAWHMNTFRVTKPASLRKEMCRIYEEAIKKNK